MKANLLLRQRIDYDGGATVKRALVYGAAGCGPTHSLKYSWFEGRPGEVSMT